MSDQMSPPAGAVRLLRAAIRDEAWRESILGDLEEEHVDHARRHGVAAARRWYWRQTLALAARFSAARLLPAVAPRRPSRLPAVEVEGRGRGAWRDVGAAWRTVRMRPALSSAVVVTLGLALAANAAIFNLADALYLRPFRFAGVDRLVVVSSAAARDPLADRSSVAPADFLEWAAGSTTLADFAAADFWDPNLSEDGEPEQLAGFRVSPSFFRLIGTTPLLGRVFVADDTTPGRDRRVVIAYGLWARRFGADPGIVGRTVRLDGEPHEIIGVTRPGPALPYGAEIWAPLALTAGQWQARERGSLLVLARLADAQSIEAARAEMEAIVARQRQAYPETHAGREVSVVTLTRGLGDEGAGPFLAIWQAAALLLLLVACANIANLLMARGAERQHEFAVRLALGASRWRLGLQVVLEGAWLAALALLFALPLAAIGVGLMRRGLPPGVLRWVPGHEFLRLDTTVLAIGAALAGSATVFFSALPALQATRAAVSDTLRQGGRTLVGPGRRRFAGTFLATAQVALTLALVVASALILGAVDAAVNGTLGFDKNHVMTATLRLDGPAYQTGEGRRQFVDRVLDRLRGMPAVESLGAVSFLPYAGSSTSRPIYPEGRSLTPAETRPADFQRATPGYFPALRIEVVEGRGLTDDDRPGTRPVAVVSRSFAERYWPGASAIGQRFRTAADAGEWIEVVGVVGDVTHDWFMQQRRPTVYRPVAQDPSFSLAFVVRTGRDPLELAGELRRAIAAADPDLPVLELRTMAQVLADKVSGVRYLATALAIMGGIALVLSLLGVYGLIAFDASQRLQELGVRLALGATRGQIIRLNLRRALTVTGAGLAVGTGLAVALGRVMSSALFGLVTVDARLLAALVVLIGVTALAAAYVPARRAATLDPTEALRST